MIYNDLKLTYSLRLNNESNVIQYKSKNKNL